MKVCVFPCDSYDDVNKMLMKTIKLLLLDKSCIRDRVSTSEQGELLKTVLLTAETLNDFISNIVKSLNISE